MKTPHCHQDNPSCVNGQCDHLTPDPRGAMPDMTLKSFSDFAEIAVKFDAIVEYMDTGADRLSFSQRRAVSRALIRLAGQLCTDITPLEAENIINRRQRP